VRVDGHGKVISQSISTIFCSAACGPDAVALALASNHYDLLAQSVRLAHAEQVSLSGQLGSLLVLPKTALFCSARCPGDAILRACDAARQWRDENRCVIRGFHSVVEKEGRRILLRGNQPIIICPARSLEKFRLPTDWKEPLARGRLLLLSYFAAAHRRVTAELAARRNESVAAIADKVWFAHIAPGGKMRRPANKVVAWDCLSG
jgi:hypothetical protein